MCQASSTASVAGLEEAAASTCLPVKRKERNSSNLRRLKLSGASHPGKLGIMMSAVICMGQASELLAVATGGHQCAHLFVEAEAGEAQDISYKQLPVVQSQRAACLPP